MARTTEQRLDVLLARFPDHAAVERAAASAAERNLWLGDLIDWLASGHADERLGLLLQTLQQSPETARRLAPLARAIVQDADFAALYADFGFAPRPAFWTELRQRLARKLLPASPDVGDWLQLFQQFTHGRAADWLRLLEPARLRQLAALLLPEEGDAAALDRRLRADLDLALTYCVSQVRAAGFAPEVRMRLARRSLERHAFVQLADAWQRVQQALQTASDAPPQAAAAETGDARALPVALNLLRTLLDACRDALDEAYAHLDEHGVSVDIVFALEQTRARLARIERLLELRLAADPLAGLPTFLAELAAGQAESSSLTALLARHSELLARKVSERSAETGEHYITRNRGEYRQMLRKAAGGGAVIAGTTFLKFGIGQLGMAPFWAGFWAGINYAASFVFVHVMHWTVATKQPAMTAPAMAAKLQDVRDEAAVEGFVDEVANLTRSQAAGIIGNVALCFPLVLIVQLLSTALRGAPLVDAVHAPYILKSLSILGPTALYAAFTGVLLFASSQIAGWCENAFVFHHLQGALAWNRRITGLIGPERAQRLARYCRANVSGYAANISLGLLLGLVPAFALFFGLPIEVRHVTLSSGQLAAALGALGFGLLLEPAFWWVAIGVAVTGVLNVGVSFFCAFHVALRARSVQVRDRTRIYAAIRARLRRRPLDFIRPPPEPSAA
jgi:site-specific recombinase